MNDNLFFFVIFTYASNSQQVYGITVAFMVGLKNYEKQLKI